LAASAIGCATTRGCWLHAGAAANIGADVGTEVELHVLPEASHGFLHFPTPLARVVSERTHAWIRARIAQFQPPRGEGAQSGVDPQPSSAGDSLAIMR
jgi:hypothetical protein